MGIRPPVPIGEVSTPRSGLPNPYAFPSLLICRRSSEWTATDRLTSDGERRIMPRTDPRELRNGMASGSGGLPGSDLPEPSHTLRALPNRRTL